MTEETRRLYQQRADRVHTTIALQEPDCVPVAPKANMYYMRNGGITMYEAMKDIRNAKNGVKKFLDQFAPDLVWSPLVYPMDPLNMLEATYIHMPGPDHGLDLDATFQILDDCYLEQEEYDDFIFDPTNFILTKVLPRKNNALKAFEQLCFNNPAEFSFLGDIAIFSKPEVRESMRRLMIAGEMAQKWLDGMQEIRSFVMDAGFPLGPAIAQTCPFDMLSDNIRGMINAVCDVVECPDKIMAAVDVMTEVCLRRTVNFTKAQNSEYVFIPLHAGVDEFMSSENYEKFYWPGLQKLILALIEGGMTPYIFCEGRYDKRLEVLRDVPKGKVVYAFEKVDIKNAKKILGDVACICGNLPTSLLAFGTPEQVADEAKRLIDICAPGGGFIMDTSLIIDNAKNENMEALFQTTREYGKY